MRGDTTLPLATHLYLTKQMEESGSILTLPGRASVSHTKTSFKIAGRCSSSIQEHINIHQQASLSSVIHGCLYSCLMHSFCSYNLSMAVHAQPVHVCSVIVLKVSAVLLSA